MLNITIKHRDFKTSSQAAFELSNNLRALFGARVLGPQEPVVKRISNMYLQRIILKMERQSSPQQMKSLMMETVNKLIGGGLYKGVVIQIAVDPY
jgi:primosomal protein N' (replication factor Y)